MVVTLIKFSLALWGDGDHFHETERENIKGKGYKSLSPEYCSKMMDTRCRMEMKGF